MNANNQCGIFTELHALIVPVSDMARSRKWYSEVLGLSPRKVLPDEFMTVYGTGGATNICLYDAKTAGEEPGYGKKGCFGNWRTSNIEETHSWLVDKGVKCTDVVSGEGISFFTFYDPDGNRMDVCEFGPDWLD